VGELGAGAMGQVYRAHHRKLGRDVALKVLPPMFSKDPERLLRFEREARILASLNHPHIAAIYGFEEADGVRAALLPRRRSGCRQGSCTTSRRTPPKR
jgi:serine/threonine protein kinase